MPKRYRVVIRAFNLRRDAASAILLARVLERMGCPCFIASGRNFRKALKLWKPHAVVVSTVGEIDTCIELSPNALTVQWPGEGSESLRTSTAWYLHLRPELYDRLDLVLLWGTENGEYFDELFPGANRDKLALCGNPRLDLVKFNPKLKGLHANSNSIGLVGRFNSINHHDARPTMFSLRRIANVESVINQIHSFVAVVNVIRYLLEHTDYHINIRPHPNEAAQSYTQYIKPWAPDRITIDESLDFAHWVAQHKAVVTPSSTSFLECYLLGVPVINLDRLTNSEAFIRSIQPYTTLGMKVGDTPPSYDELYEFLKETPPKPKPVPEIDDHLDRGHNWFQEGSAVKRAAEAIVAGLKRKRPKVGLHAPRLALHAIDSLSFKRAQFRSALHANYDFKSGYHVVPDYMDEVAENIMAS